jgi:hypothetical protein
MTVQILACMLRANADALTTPPIKMFYLTFGFHHTTLIHLAKGGKSP